MNNNYFLSNHVIIKMKQSFFIFWINFSLQFISFSFQLNKLYISLTYNKIFLAFLIVALLFSLAVKSYFFMIN